MLAVVIPGILACNQWVTVPVSFSGKPDAQDVSAPLAATTAPPAIKEPAIDPGFVPGEEVVSPPSTSDTHLAQTVHEQPAAPARKSEPAGCLAFEEQLTRQNIDQMLDYADSLLANRRKFESRRMGSVWNGYTRQVVTGATRAIALNVADVQNTYQIQYMMNALQVSGFVTWLRRVQDSKDLQILAIPLIGELEPTWAPYVLAYWQDRENTPAGDETVISTLKIPPCRWMVQAGYAPEIDQEWWPVERYLFPDYSGAAESYQAANGLEAAKIAERINWLGPGEQEGAATMCGPLVWSILNDAGAFPPGFGAWLAGPKSFWLADPRNNGRPWSLFSAEDYRIYRFAQPLGKFDFSTWPLYPGDFLYTYSKRDGFDHMLLVTEIDPGGNVYTVTNLIKVDPERKVTIERAILYNMFDLQIGLARNEWQNDGANGRTGHDGFDVFRWAWADKNIQQSAAAYQVKPGDTFELIAERWKTPPEQIAQANQKSLGEDLAVGEIIHIPPVLTYALPMP